MPFIHPERRLKMGGPLLAFNDELPVLYAAGIRAVVSLLNNPSDAVAYGSAGFTFKCLPLPDGGAPTIEQALDFVAFVDRMLADKRPIAVHCEAGLGRTGTMLATYLISQGNNAEQAIARVRAAESAAVETPHQIQFLEQFAIRSGSIGAAQAFFSMNASVVCRTVAGSHFRHRRLLPILMLAVPALMPVSVRADAIDFPMVAGIGIPSQVAEGQGTQDAQDA